MTRFKDFTLKELAFIGAGLAVIGKDIGGEKEVLPLLKELNQELTERTQ